MSLKISLCQHSFIILLFRRRIGPKSVLRKIGYDVLGEEEDGSSTSEDEDPATISRLPNGLKYR